MKEAAVARETPKRAAFFLAAMSVALGVVGSMRAVEAFGSTQPTVIAWTALPLGLATVGIVSSLSRWMGPIWLCTGGLFGFVVLGAWSLGLFYAYSALAMFTAALIHLVAVRPGWRAALAPMWMLAGAGGVSATFFLRDVLQSSKYVHVTHAPIVVWGSCLFVAVSVLLLVLYGLLGLRHSAS